MKRASFVPRQAAQADTVVALETPMLQRPSSTPRAHVAVFTSADDVGHSAHRSDDEGSPHPKRLRHDLAESLLKRGLGHDVRAGHDPQDVAAPAREPDVVLETVFPDLILQGDPARPFPYQQDENRRHQSSQADGGFDQELLALLGLEAAEAGDDEAPVQGQGRSKRSEIFVRGRLVPSGVESVRYQCDPALGETLAQQDVPDQDRRDDHATGAMVRQPLQGKEQPALDGLGHAIQGIGVVPTHDQAGGGSERAREPADQCLIVVMHVKDVDVVFLHDAQEGGRRPRILPTVIASDHAMRDGDVGVGRIRDGATRPERAGQHGEALSVGVPNDGVDEVVPVDDARKVQNADPAHWWGLASRGQCGSRRYHGMSG